MICNIFYKVRKFVFKCLPWTCNTISSGNRFSGLMRFVWITTTTVQFCTDTCSRSTSSIYWTSSFVTRNRNTIVRCSPLFVTTCFCTVNRISRIVQNRVYITLTAWFHLLSSKSKDIFFTRTWGLVNTKNTNNNRHLCIFTIHEESHDDSTRLQLTRGFTLTVVTCLRSML